jgi:hypothetical protein
MSQSGAELIRIERQRQIMTEGYTPEKDRGRGDELMAAAECYLWANNAQTGTHAIDFEEVQEEPPIWPWDEEYWKPSRDPVRNLVKAGALVAAAIDALSSDPTNWRLLQVRPMCHCGHSIDQHQIQNSDGDLRCAECECDDYFEPSNAPTDGDGMPL